MTRHLSDRELDEISAPPEKVIFQFIIKQCPEWRQPIGPERLKIQKKFLIPDSMSNF